MKRLDDSQLKKVKGGIAFTGQTSGVGDTSFLSIDGIEGECTVQFDATDFIVV